MNVAPKSVSGRVEKTRTSTPPGMCVSGALRKTTSAPSLRPIQFVCMMRTGSGQSMPLKSSSSSVYFVMRRNHWARSRFSTFAPHLQQRRSAPSTCSRASVPSLGHQSTGAVARYARPASRKRRKSHWFQR
jgi:hypothetical protein